MLGNSDGVYNTLGVAISVILSDTGQYLWQVSLQNAVGIWVGDGNEA